MERRFAEIYDPRRPEKHADGFSLLRHSSTSVSVRFLVITIVFQIKSESFLEDLNNILNSGDVPNIYQFDELEQIYTAMKPVVSEAGLPPTKTNLYSSYTKRVRQNLHTVVCMR